MFPRKLYWLLLKAVLRKSVRLCLCAWGHSHHLRPSGESPGGGSGLGPWSAVEVAVFMRKFSNELALALGEISGKELPVQLCCFGEEGVLLLGCAEPSPLLLYCSNPRDHWGSQRQFITGTEIELQCFNHKASPPTCLSLFFRKQSRRKWNSLLKTSARKRLWHWGVLSSFLLIHFI